MKLLTAKRGARDILAPFYPVVSRQWTYVFISAVLPQSEKRGLLLGAKWRCSRRLNEKLSTQKETNPQQSLDDALFAARGFGPV